MGRWGKHCRHPSELCGLLFSMSHDMKNEEHDYKYPEPRGGPFTFFQNTRILMKIDLIAVPLVQVTRQPPGVASLSSQVVFPALRMQGL